MSSVNKVTILGNVGNDPEIKTMSSGDRVANLSVATSESWKDKATGERKERVQWHRVVVFNQGLIGVIENYVKKGTKIYIEGQLETRSWEQDGQTKYATEVVMRPFSSTLTLLGSKNDGQQQEQHPQNAPQQQQQQQQQEAPINPQDIPDDEIPF